MNEKEIKELKRLEETLEPFFEKYGATGLIKILHGVAAADGIPLDGAERVLKAFHDFLEIETMNSWDDGHATAEHFYTNNDD